MLLRKFRKSDHDLYPAYLPLLSPKDLTLNETIEKCEARFKCLNLARREGEDVYKYIYIVNRMCNVFSPQTQHTYPNNSNDKPKCAFCGRFYFHKDCLFYKYQCQDCNLNGHKKRFCQSSQRQPYTGYRRGHYQNQHHQTHSILTAIQVNVSGRRYENFCINGIYSELQVGTGSNITGVSSET
ncbi:unnamed protein product [Hymenolepis diminuta]|uniref:Uncharacterized protein n=1 Tax=Hymenolepis diminuta TaxID=6216 RepID=A0A564YL31_HYMDI|nr:unnamed protein product [Hymenolepis diminuta]